MLNLFDIRITLVGMLMLMEAGCDQYRGSFPPGTKLYDKATHRLFGKVTAYDRSHTFENGLVVPAVQVTMSAADGQDAGHETSAWCACDVVQATYVTK